jgi:hypothetical protein
MFLLMRGKWLLWVRRTHLYLSVFFAPLLLLFVITGWAQTMDFDHSTTLMQKLSRVHTSQYFPTESAPDRKTVFTTGSPAKFEIAGHTGAKNAVKRISWPTKWLVAAMCVALIVSISLGLVLAFTMVRNRIPVWIALILGVATPVLLLAIAHM